MSNSSPSKDRRLSFVYHRACIIRRRRWTPPAALLVVLVCSFVAMFQSVDLVSRTPQLRTPHEELNNHSNHHIFTGHDRIPVSHENQSTSVPEKTLALLTPPGLLGGYRNQVLRFIAFCVHAAENGISGLLLPSLLWSTQLPGDDDNDTKNIWFPIPMEWLFDVEHWNNVTTATETTNNYVSGAAADNHLPRLVTGMAQDADCWTYATADDAARIVDNNNTQTLLNPLQLAALRAGSVSPISNVTHATIAGIRNNLNPRSEDLLDQVRHCRNPFVYGGGIRAGRLWNEYIGFAKKWAKSKKNVSTTATSMVPYQMDRWVYRALLPAPHWRQLAHQCVQAKATSGRYAALHARVELEIMGHVCGNDMDWNLTLIVQRVNGLLATPWSSQQLDGNRTTTTIPAAKNPIPSVSGLFIAVSRAGMESKGPLYNKFRTYAEENLETLNRLAGNESTPTLGVGLLLNPDEVTSNKKIIIPVFECGQRVLQEYYHTHLTVPDHGSLLQSVLNFYIAVNADIFVGVRGSSYSTDVMTTRYYLGKGKYNYRYTKERIELVENGGLPQPHSNCKRTKQRPPAKE
jgi:hypothetical protein